MRITNTHNSALGLPNGQVLEAGKATPVRNWDEVKKNHVVQAWLKAGILLEEGATIPTTADDKDDLISQLAALGVKADRRSSIDRLQQLMSEAQEKAKSDKKSILNGSDKLPAHIEIADGISYQLGQVVARAHADSGLTVEAWNELPDEDREQRLEDTVAALKAEAGKV